MDAFDFASDHSDVDITDPLAIAKLAYAGVKEMGPAAQAKKKKNLEDEADEMCAKMLDHMLGSLEEIE